MKSILLKLPFWGSKANGGTRKKIAAALRITNKVVLAIAIFYVLTVPVTAMASSTTSGAQSQQRHQTVRFTNTKYTVAQVGGKSGTADSTGISLTFDKDVNKITVDNLTVKGNTGGVVTGGFAFTGKIYTLSLTGVAKEGTIEVKIADFGTFKVKTGVQTVTVYKNKNPEPTSSPATTSTAATTTVTITPATTNPIKFTDVKFTVKQIGGKTGTSDTVELEITFDKDITELTADKITVTNKTGAVTTGDLKFKGKTYTLSLKSVTKEGTVTIGVTNFGTFMVKTFPQTVTVYKRVESIYSTESDDNSSDDSSGGTTPGTQLPNPPDDYDGEDSGDDPPEGDILADPPDDYDGEDSGDDPPEGTIETTTTTTTTTVTGTTTTGTAAIAAPGDYAGEDEDDSPPESNTILTVE